MSKPSSTFFIKACIDRYEKDFPDDWIEESLEWDNFDKASTSATKGRKAIVDYVKFCFINIAKSLLSGEYIVNRQTFDDAKGTFEKYWSKEHLCPELPGCADDIVQCKVSVYRFYELLDKHLSALFDSYTTFVVSVDEKLEFGKHAYLFKIKTQDPQLIKGFHYFLVLRKLLIPLCEIEHHLEFSDKTREQVAVLIEQFEMTRSEESDPECSKIFALAIEKGKFILKKLLRAGDSFEILINCDKKIINRGGLGLSDSLERYFSCYERVHENLPHPDTEMADCQIRIYESMNSWLDMALLMDHYCSSGKSIEQINNLLVKFDNKYKDLKRSGHRWQFDKHALCTLRNFMYNCRLGYKVKQSWYTIESLKKDIAKIESLQENTLVSNFYPYKKAIVFLIDSIRQKIEKRDLDFDYDGNISLLKSYLAKFDTNIDWCEAHKFYPIQLPFDECIVEVDDLRLIIPSTITRPIDYKKLREEQASFHGSLDFFRTSQIYLKDKADIQNVKEEVKNIEKRYLEIGGILIGIVTFLLGTINIFTDKEAPLQHMFGSILGLGMILVLFACLIVIVIENYWNTPTNKTRIIFCSIVVGIYTVIAATLAFKPFFKESDISPTGSTSTEIIKADQDSLSRPIINLKSE